MNSHDVDLLVIGAGANGSCVAYEASKRGLKVALLDAGDIGCYERQYLLGFVCLVLSLANV